MCITQSRRRRSYGLNLAAYTAAYAKEAPERTAGQTTTNGASYTTSAATRPNAPTATSSSSTQQQGEQFVDPRDGTAFTAVAFPDADDANAAFDVLDVDVPAVQQPGVVSDAGSQPIDLGETTTTTPSSSVVAASSRGEEFQPLEGQYVQGVYIPPSKPAPKRTRKPQKAGLTAKRNVRHFIQHNYHDHSDEVPTEADVSAEPTTEQVEEAIRLHNMTGGKSGKGGGKATSLLSSSASGSTKISFPRKLHHILDQIERDGYAHVISWLPHGRAFAIHKPKEFIATVMPHYFQQSKITSFQRQLNLYGFQRLTRGRDNGGYYHEYFLRGMPFLTKNITRTRVKGTRFKGASNPEAEPNFYGMKPVGLGGVHQRQQVQNQVQVQAPAPVVPVAPAPAPMPMPMPMPVAFTRRVSDGSDTSSLSSPSAHMNNMNNTNPQQQGYCALQRANPIGGQYMPSHLEVPRQVVVPVSQQGHSHSHSHNPTQCRQYQQYQQISSAAIAAAAVASAKKMAASACASPTPTPVTAGMAAYAHYQAKKSSVVPSPITTSASQQQQQQQQQQPASICDLWEDQPDAFEPNPYVPSPPASPARHQVVAPTTTAAAAAKGTDPLLDLVESWAHDDTMDDLVEQAIENDVDFGHLLDMIAQE